MRGHGKRKNIVHQRKSGFESVQAKIETLLESRVVRKPKRKIVAIP